MTAAIRLGNKDLGQNESLRFKTNLRNELPTLSEVLVLELRPERPSDLAAGVSHGTRVIFAPARQGALDHLG